MRWDETRRDETRRGEARRDETRRDETRQDKTRQDKTRQDKISFIFSPIYIKNISRWLVYDQGASNIHSANICIYIQNITKSLRYLRQVHYIWKYEMQWKVADIVSYNHSLVNHRKQILYSTKDGENDNKDRREICIRGADVRFHKYWKSSCVMISKFGLLTVRLKVRKSSFHNSLHNTALSFHSLAPKYETVLRPTVVDFLCGCTNLTDWPME